MQQGTSSEARPVARSGEDVHDTLQACPVVLVECCEYGRVEIEDADSPVSRDGERQDDLGLGLAVTS